MEDRPSLVVIAGCNGSGKSSYSRAITTSASSPFDYDKVFLVHYKSMFDFELKEEMAHNKAFSELENEISIAIAERRDFAYETNFNSTPLHWPQLFKEKGYRLELIFLCLESIDLAQERVRIRVENGGHFVPPSEVERRYWLGYKNLDANWSYFDAVFLYESSKHLSLPKLIFTFEDNQKMTVSTIPNYLYKLLPSLLRP